MSDLQVRVSRRKTNPPQRDLSQYSNERLAQVVHRCSRRFFRWHYQGIKPEDVTPAFALSKLILLGDALKEWSKDIYMTEILLTYIQGYIDKSETQTVFEQIEKTRRYLVQWQKRERKKENPSPQSVMTEKISSPDPKDIFKLAVRIYTIQQTAQRYYQLLQKLYEQKGKEFGDPVRIDQTLPGITAQLISEITTKALTF